MPGTKRRNKRLDKEKMNIKIDVQRQESELVNDQISGYYNDQALSAPVKFSKRVKAEAF